ncbi:MAG: SpoIIE family protein phosphatase [Rhodospirillales bacterium]|nr:SpoIIE family protein phosphatase [Rhodospirillales bacterium]
MARQEAAEIQVFDSGEHFAEQIELLALMGRDFATSLDIEKTLFKTLEHITHYMDAASGALFLLDESGEHLRCEVCVGETEITGLVLKSDQGIVGRSVQNNSGEVIHDVATDPDFNNAVDAETGFTTKSILCAPISVQEQKIGAIELINRKSGDGLFVQSDLTMLEAMASSAGLAILNARMAESLVEQERVRRELELAAEIQRSLLPSARDTHFPVHGINQPAREISGDFYDFFPLPDGRICFNLGDVSGKGMNAALLMAKTASLFRCLGKTIHDPGPLMSKVNEEIFETVTRGMFVTMVAGVYNPATGVVRLANAGHEPPIFHKADGSFSFIPADVPPLGITPHLSDGEPCPEVEFQLDGGALYVFTDGVTEGYIAEGVTLEVEGVTDLLTANAGLPAPERLKKIIERISGADLPLRDDLTILSVDDRSCAEARRKTPRNEVPVSSDSVQNRETLLKLQFPGKPDRLRLVRSSVSETAKLCGCNTEDIEAIVIAVDEACQNIIRHAYGATQEGDIILEIRRRGDEIVIFLRDFADPVDVSKIKPRDLDEIRPGGLGTHFIQELMDEAKFLAPPADGGNLMRMIKKIK